MSDTIHADLKAMQALIRLVSAGARKEDISGISVDWNAVFPVMAEQQVIPLVACAVLHSPGLECPDQLREYLLNVMRVESSTNLIRRQRIMHLLQEMKTAGIAAKVIKGYAVSGCYTHPECRGSMDTDLLVDVSQEKAAIDLLETKDFRVSIRGATSHHSVCQHKKYGMLELHVALYAELIREIWFGNVTENELVQEAFIEVTDENGTFVTLGHTDHLIFLTLHMIKHFILEGLTLRMMLDLALFYSKHRDVIDVERYWKVMKKLHYDQLICGVLWNMISHGSFEQSDFPGLTSNIPVQTSAILEDLLRGGYMGSKEKEARHKSGMQYNRQMLLKEKSQWQYALFMTLWKLRSGLNAMFPTAQKLCKKYPCAEKNNLLIPFVWIYHVASFPIKNRYKIKPGRDIQWNAAISNDIVQQRMELFGRLGMLDK
jgi:hypothetical protein